MKNEHKFYLVITLIIGFLAGFVLGRASFTNDVGVVIETLAKNGEIAFDSEAMAKKEREEKRRATQMKALESKFEGIKRFGGSMEKSPSLGEDDAPVTILEYSDYQCPFCASFFNQTMPSIMSQYIKTGQVRFEYKDFPLSFHKNAAPAAEYARCAGEQNAYWYMHDLIFANQADWSNKNQFEGEEIFRSYAEDLSLDMEDFDACTASNKYDELIQADFKEGSSKGVDGTPGFFINGEKVSGAQPFAVFDQTIKKKLGSAE